MYHEKKISGPKIKKFLIFSQKKAFLLFSEVESSKKLLIFQGRTSKLEKQKKNSLKKFLMFRKRKLFSHKIRNFLILSSLSSQIFSLKKFLKFSWFLYFLKKNFFLYFGKQNFLILWKAELFSPKNKKFQKWTFKAWKTSYILENGSF